MFTRALTLIALCATTLPLLAADDEGPTYLSPKEAGPDYVIQGEYLGEVDADNGRGQWGAQVIALGEGKFTLVGYEGGLPGEGWKRTDRKETAEGKTEGGITRFQADQLGSRDQGRSPHRVSIGAAIPSGN